MKNESGARIRYVSAITVLLLGAFWLSAQNAAVTDIPVTRIALFSSGVGYFEHTSVIDGSVSATLPFNVSAVNDVLKSLVISDPSSTSPSVTYPSEDTLLKTLKSLKIDLSGNPGIAQILDSLRGAEMQVFTPKAIVGRIIGVEQRPGAENQPLSAFVSLSTKEGIKVIGLNEIDSFTFTDKKIADDLNRALDLIASSKDAQTRKLQVNLNGKGSRSVTLGYVIASPVWKVSYRLDLAGGKPFLQGWAIIDNTGDMDWNGVELSLVTGRPVSFIQNLYPPLNLTRPVLPLSIAGIAEAQTFDSGYGRMDAEESLSDYAPAPSPSMRASAGSMAKEKNLSEMKQDFSTLTGGVLETTRTSAAGDQFAFTVKKPVTLARQQSAMIPLVESEVKARKISVFSMEKGMTGKSEHPLLCAELTNSTGMKLPAGPITVFDGGTYAGDALIEFYPENEKRIIAFGEDLSVNGSVSGNTSKETASVVMTKGVMTITRQYTYTKTYTFRNASSQERTMVIEHPILSNSQLILPVKYDEKTDTLYRFSLLLAANAEASLDIKERSPVQERVILSQQKLDTILYYSSSKDIPAKVKAVLEKAVEFKRKADTASAALVLLETKKTDKINEQSRIRQNLQAAGNDTQQGKDYLKKLTVSDNEIDALSAQIDTARKAVQDAQGSYDAYLSTLTLE